MTKRKALEIMELVKENHARLCSCHLHEFVEISEGDLDYSGIKYESRILGKKYKCTNCGGEVDSMTKHWYDKGVEHGKRDLTPDGVSEC